MNGRETPGLSVVFRTGAVIGIGLLTLGLLLALGGAAASLADRALRAGLVVIMMTPAANVVLAGIEFAIERDWRFVGLSAVVVVLLLLSLVTAYTL